MLRNEDYDFVITDLRMPELDGHGLIEWIGELTDRPRPLVFVLTGKAMSRDDATALESKVESVLSKTGLSPSRLAEALSNAGAGKITGVTA